MFFSKALTLACAAALTSVVSAYDYGYGDETKSTTAIATVTGTAEAVEVPTEVPEGQVLTHVIQVGDREGSLKFYPEELKASPGDLVQFQFYPRNHSVAQSSFADPCIPIEDSDSGNGTVGFFSGFMPVTMEDDFMPTFTVLVNDTKPIWFYCATGPHCKNGMVGVINPPANNPDRTIEKYREAAAGADTVAPDVPAGGDADPEGDDVIPVVPDNGEIEVPLVPGNGSLPDSDAPEEAEEGMGSRTSISAVTVMLGAVAAAFMLA